MKAIFQNRISRFATLVLLAIASSLNAYADVGAGIAKATSEINKYMPAVQKLCYAIAGIVFIVGAVSIFIKMSNDEQDVKKSIMMLIAGVIFLVVAAAIAPTLFS